MPFAQGSITSPELRLEKEFGRLKAKRILMEFRSLLHLIAIDEKIMDQAFASNIKDFEDAVQYFAAQSKRITVLITRNKKDYPRDSMMLLTCEEYLSQIAR